MRINGFSQNNLYLNGRQPSGRDAEAGGQALGAGPGKQPTRSADTVEQVRPVTNYKGHGMLEQYPSNLTLAYVSAHEARHANKNRSDAGNEGGQARQNISYSVNISPDGRVMATGGVTKSRPPSSNGGGGPEIAVQSRANSQATENQGLLSPAEWEARIKEFHLARKKESLQRELKGTARQELNPGNQKIQAQAGQPTKNPAPDSQIFPSDSQQANSALTDFSGKNSNSLSQSIKKAHIRGRLSRLESEAKQSGLSQATDQGTARKAPSSRKTEASAKPEVSQSPVPKEDHVDISSVATSSYYFAQRSIPNAVLTNGAGSAFEINNLLNRTDFHKPPRSYPESVTFRLKSTAGALSAINAIGSEFRTLAKVASSLGSPTAINARSAESSFPEAVSVKTSSGSPAGNYTVSVNALALPHKIFSNEYSDPYAALGLSGSFNINGYQVNVATTDSLYNIRKMINYGEDNNQNGTLNYAEDLNGNGKIDSFKVDNFGTTVYEDINYNGTLDPSEDVNSNKHLDGGTANIGIKADIQFNRLKIETVKTGSHSLTINDTNGILQTLGFYFTNSNFERRDKAQFDSNSTRLNSSAAKARFSLNGASLERSSNEVKDVLPNTSLLLKQVTSKPVSVEVRKDATTPMKNIEKFARAYNSSVSSINDALAFQKSLRSNAIVQNLRAQLVDSSNRPVGSDSRGATSLNSIGLELKNTEKRQASAFALTKTVKSVLENRRAVSSYRAQGEATLFAELRQLGIKSRKDDTLQVDHKRLSMVLEESPMKVAMTFAKKDGGVSGRLDAFLKDTLGKRGTLNMEKVRISAQATRVSSIQKADKAARARKAVAQTAVV